VAKSTGDQKGGYLASVIMSEPAAPEPGHQHAERMGGVGAVLSVQLEEAHRAGEAGKSAILVEGVSDQRAIEALGRRYGRDLRADGIVVIAMAGATNARQFLSLLGPRGYDVPLAGLCDQGEVGLLRHGLEQAGLGSRLTRADMEYLGFHVSVRDLEDELIRALGVSSVEAVIETQDELRSFRNFQNQPAQRDKSTERQLWRWMGNRKIRYAELLVYALDLERVPRPLHDVLARLSPAGESPASSRHGK
jgi:hypothetical protein